MIHDGTHGIDVNSKIVVRDQLRNPTAGDLRTLLEILPGAFFALAGDVKRAHRLVKVAREDWGLQACRSGARGPEWVWLNRVGTFGISSAAYHWSRLMAGLGRLVYYMWGRGNPPPTVGLGRSIPCCGRLKVPWLCECFVSDL